MSQKRTYVKYSNLWCISHTLPDGKRLLAPILPASTESKYSASRCIISVEDGKILLCPNGTWFIKPSTVEEITDIEFRVKAKHNMSLLHNQAKNWDKERLEQGHPLTLSSHLCDLVKQAYKHGYDYLRLFYGGDIFFVRGAGTSIQDLALFMAKNPEIQDKVHIIIHSSSVSKLNDLYMNNAVYSSEGLRTKQDAMKTFHIFAEAQAYDEMLLGPWCRVRYAWEGEMPDAFADLDLVDDSLADPYIYVPDPGRVLFANGGLSVDTK